MFMANVPASIGSELDLGHLDHLDRGVQEDISIHCLHVEWRGQPEIFLHQLVVTLHACRIQKAEPAGPRDPVAHELHGELPVHGLVLGLQAAEAVDQRLHARIRGLDAFLIGALGHLDEARDHILVGRQIISIGEDRQPVRIDAGLGPREIAHVVAELARHDVVKVVEVRGDVDGMRLERRQLAVGIEVDPGHGVGIDPVLGGERGPERALRVAGRNADLLAREILDALDAAALEPVHAERGVGIDVHDPDDPGILAARGDCDPHVGEADLREPAGDFLQHADRALAGFQIDLEARIFVPSQLLGVVHRGVIAARHPVQGDRDLVGGKSRSLRQRDHCQEYPEEYEQAGRDTWLHPRLQKLFVLQFAGLIEASDVPMTSANLDRLDRLGQ